MSTCTFPAGPLTVAAVVLVVAAAAVWWWVGRALDGWDSGLFHED